MKVKCHHCSKAFEVDTSATIPRSEECPHCYGAVRCCRMCHFWDTSAYNECREPSAERIVEKEKSNYCDYFQLAGATSESANDDSASDEANKLFKN